MNLLPEHILGDPVSGRLTAAIDFEDVAVGHPAFDFAGLGQEAAATLAGYGAPADTSSLRRAAFHRMLAPLHEMRHGALARHRGHVRGGLRAWRLQDPLGSGANAAAREGL